MRESGQETETKGSGTEIKVGMTVYGLMVSADGYFAAEGIVDETDNEGFHVKYKVLPSGTRYSYDNIGKNVYTDRDAAFDAAEDAEYEKEKEKREDFEELNKRPFEKI